jgi:hypothetical protein
VDVDSLLAAGYGAMELRRFADALEAFERVADAGRDSLEELGGHDLVSALVGKRDALDGLGRSDEAVRVDDDLVARFGSTSQQFAREHVAYAALHALKWRVGRSRRGDVESQRAAFLELLGNSDEPAVRVRLIEGLNECAWRLIRRHRPDLAWEVLDDSLARFADNEDAEIEMHLAWTRERHAEFASSWSAYVRALRLVGAVAVVALGVVAYRSAREFQ